MALIVLKGGLAIGHFQGMRNVLIVLDEAYPLVVLE